MKNLIKALVLPVMVVGTAAISSAAPCTTGNIITGNIDLGVVLTAPGMTCEIGAFTFSNFQVAGASSGLIQNWQLNIFNVIGSQINFSYTGGYQGFDFQLVYTVSPNPGSMILSSSTANITETICSAAYNPNGVFTGFYAGLPTTCGGAGGVSDTETATAGSAPKLIGPIATSGLMTVFKDVSGGSDFTQTIVPEPISVSLVGFGLLGLGLVGRKRRK